MCGITGIFSGNQNVKTEWIIRMTDTIRHRGPDDEGFLAIDTRGRNIYQLTGKDSQVDYSRIEVFGQNVNLFLGHRRLSILDLSVLGHQPMLQCRRNALDNS